MSRSLPPGECPDPACEPELIFVCTECEEEDETCWRCGGTGKLPEDKASSFTPTITVHEEHCDTDL